MVKVIVQCPKCSSKFVTSNLKKAKCPNEECKSFVSIYPKGKRARILGVVEGDIPEVVREHQKLSHPPRIGEIPCKTDITDIKIQEKIACANNNNNP